MSASRRLMAVLVVLLPALLGRPASAAEILWREALWVCPDGADSSVPTLLTLPGGWSLGDAAVILIPDHDLPGPLRYRVLEALLDADTAVLELDPAAARAMLSEGARPVAAMAPEPGAMLAAALQSLQVEVGAGLVVVMGLGRAGDAALGSAVQAAAGDLPYGPAAAAAFGGPGPARFRLGAEPPAFQRWPLRARLLCELLAGLTGGEDAQRHCDATLLSKPRPVVTVQDGGRRR